VRNYWREYGLSVRTSNCLLNSGISDISQLALLSRGDLLQTPNFGKKSLKELEEFMRAHDVHFRADFTQQQIDRVIEFLQLRGWTITPPKVVR